MADPSPAENPIDLPTGEPIPAPTPAAALPTTTTTSSSSSPSDAPPPGSRKARPATTTARALAARLAALPSGADAFLAHLQRCLATPGGVDTTLLFVCYASRLSGALLSALARALLRRSARELVALALPLPRGKTAAAATIILTSSSSSSPAAAAAAAAAPAAAAAARLAALLGARLKSLGDLASEARTIARLWALLGMYAWARRLVLQLFSSSPQSDEGSSSTTAAATSKLATAVSWAQLLSCTAFQLLENGAYLSGRGVLGWTPREQGRAYVVGSRCLAVYTGLEIGKLLADVVARRQASAAAHEEDKEAKEKESEEEERVHAEAVRRSLAVNLAWTPLTLHWATEGGFLSDAAVGFGGCIPGVIQMRKLWRETAQC